MALFTTSWYGNAVTPLDHQIWNKLKFLTDDICGSTLTLFLQNDSPANGVVARILVNSFGNPDLHYSNLHKTFDKNLK